MARLPRPGGDDNTWGKVLNDFLSVSLEDDGTIKTDVLPATPDATTTVKGIVQLTGDLGGTAASPRVPGLANKANDTTVVHLNNNETITGAKIFTSSPNVPTPKNATDAANKAYVDTAASKSERTQTFTSSGPLMTEQGGHRLYNDTGQDWTIVSVRGSVGVPSTGSAIVVDVKVSGATIFTTQSNRPQIAANANTSGLVTTMDVTTVASGQYLTVDVAQVGSTTPGNDLVVQVEVY